MRGAAFIACCLVLLGASASVARAFPAADSSLVKLVLDPRRVAVQALRPADTGPSHWFYNSLPYGSEALIHPLRLIANGGFGTLQFDNRGNRLSDVRFRRGWDRLWGDVRAPGRTIALEGWADFLQTEVIPVSVNRKTSRYWPNYTLHLIGGGMSGVMMREWYEQHGYRHPSAGAGVTLAAYHLLNEVVEASGRSEPSTDPIADLLLFDPAGVWLFGHERVARFFGQTLNLRDWSGQPAIDPATGAVENNGQNFSIKVGIPRVERWKVFYYFGNHGEAGLSYGLPNGSAFSLGAGLVANELIDLGKGIQMAELVPSSGFFYDRNGSLMFSITSAKSSRYDVRVNAYPGLLVDGAGLFLLHVRRGGVVMGVHLTHLPIGAAGRP